MGCPVEGPVHHYNIKLGKSNRYMDDIWAFLKALREGWRWNEGSLCFTKSWEAEDKES